MQRDVPGKSEMKEEAGFGFLIKPVIYENLISLGPIAHLSRRVAGNYTRRTRHLLIALKNLTLGGKSADPSHIQIGHLDNNCPFGCAALTQGNF